MSASPSTSPTRKVDYGIDAPGVVRTLMGCGAALLAVGIVGPTLHFGSVRIHSRWMGLIWGGILLAEAAHMLLYSKRGKFAHRDRMLNMVQWRGDESVLDVGTGRGLMAIGAAKKLTSGRVVGIDIWTEKDLSGNSMEATQANIEMEGVRDRVELRTEDARKMSFADASFDVVLSNLCIHNIPSEDGRAAAIREIARVLKPGGVAIISDLAHAKTYAAVFESCGLRTTRSSPSYFKTFPPLTIVEARKPQ